MRSRDFLEIVQPIPLLFYDEICLYTKERLKTPITSTIVKKPNHTCNNLVVVHPSAD